MGMGTGALRWNRLRAFKHAIQHMLSPTPISIFSACTIPSELPGEIHTMQLAATFAVLWALAVAGTSRNKTSKTRIQSIASDTVARLNTTSPIRASPSLGNGGSSRRPVPANITKPDTGRNSIWNATTGDCLNPLDAPAGADCEAVCDGISRTRGAVVVYPGQVWSVQADRCFFTLSNLEPCQSINWTPASGLAPYCWSMYRGCAVNRFDGYLEGPDPHMAMALSGSFAAPPYSPGQCG
ncbi:hypothetical protein F4818DRAFT_185055 [Hypoxylon cercidicola]|nr:hypothetical protein F4818DRAFT_185055 [Hypoxylon cercidicola]